MYDIDKKTGTLVLGAAKAGWQSSGNIKVRSRWGSDHHCQDGDQAALDAFRQAQAEGRGEGHRLRLQRQGDRPQALITLLHSDNMIGFLIAEKMSFDNTDLGTVLTRVAVYNGTGGFYLRRDNFLTKLPLFAVGRYPSEGRFWVRGTVNRNADNGENFVQDDDFLKACLMFTVLGVPQQVPVVHRQRRPLLSQRVVLRRLCRSHRRNRSPGGLALNDADKALLHQWSKVMDEAKQTANYNPALSYGTYQIKDDLNTSHRVKVGDKTQTVYDYPVLNGELKTLKAMTMAYHAEQVAPKLWDYGLLK